MKRKEEAMKKYIASFLAICMIFVMVPILPAEAAGLEDTERVEILELVESYMDSRETAVMTGDTESLRTVAVNGIVNDENAHRITLSENNVSVSDMSFQISGIDIEDTITFVTLYESMEYVDDGVVKTADIEHNLTIMYDEAYDVAKVVSDSYRETVSGFQSCSYVSEEIQAVSEALYSLNPRLGIKKRLPIQTWIVSQRTPVLQTTPNMVNGMGLTPQHGVQYLLVGAQVKRAYQHPLFLSILPARQE